jgi:hypothetical protein
VPEFDTASRACRRGFRPVRRTNDDTTGHDRGRQIALWLQSHLWDNRAGVTFIIPSAANSSRHAGSEKKMNQYQRVIVVVTALNVVLLLLFPPILDTSILRGASHSFDSFSPIFAIWGTRQIYWDLLTIEIVFVVTNALAGWLVMQHSGDRPERSANVNQGLLIFGAVDAALIFSFPPFEQYSSLIRIQIPHFDGFYFLFGDKMQRHFFVPLLYLECMLIAIDLLILYLLFGVVRRNLSADDARLLDLARALPPERRAQLSQDMAVEIETMRLADLAQVNRRLGDDPAFAGAERRAGYERRKRPRKPGK